MKAAVYVAPNTIELQDYPDPQVNDGLLLQIKTCGVCGTDVKALKGNRPGFEPPMILGHEFSGMVVDSKVEGFKAGDRISVAPYAGCGECSYCNSGHEELCRRKVFASGGAFAERVFLPAALVRKTGWKIPETVTMEEASMAEPLACVILSLLASGWKPGYSILVAGAGVMGLLHVILARGWGARRVLVSEPSESRRKMSESLGAVTFDPESGDLCAWASQQTGGMGPNIVTAAVGSAKVVESVINCAVPGGVVHVFGGLPKDVNLSVSAYTIHYKEVSLTGTSGYRTSDYKLAAEMIANQVIDLKPLISARFSLDRTAEAVHLAGDGGAFKVMVLP